MKDKVIIRRKRGWIYSGMRAAQKTLGLSQTSLYLYLRGDKKRISAEKANRIEVVTVK